MKELEKIEKLVADGFSPAKIGQMLKKSLISVNALIKENNFTLKNEIFDNSQKAKIMGLYREGVSAKQLGWKYHIDKRRIIKWAKEEGVFRNAHDAARVHQVNEHIFDKIDTEEKAYWLGFCYADAYNCEITDSINIGLKSTDIDHLRKYCKFMGYEEYLIQVRKSKCGRYESALVHINSKYLCQKLHELGCPQAKSLILTYPKWLDSNLDMAFIRGYFDGDGSIKCRKSKEYGFSMVGTKEFLYKVQSLLFNNGSDIYMRYISATENNTFELAQDGNLKVQRILDIIYKNASIYLDRKYQRYQNLCALNKERHPKLFRDIKFNDIFTINTRGPDIILTKEYLSNLTSEEKQALAPAIVNKIMDIGLLYPDDDKKVIAEYNNLQKYVLDITQKELNNNSYLGVYLCKYFCHSFFDTKTRSDPSIADVMKNREIITYVVNNKLGLNDEKYTNYNFTMQSVIREIKLTHRSSNISIFKPTIAKYMCMKYSNEGDTVGDYACGFGGRLLGAMSCGRRYIGTDPLTGSELRNMIDFFNFDNATIIDQCSEYYKGKENSIDLYWSSPPYFDYEVYSNALTQAYTKGEDHFYNKYWRNTLENVKYMLKPGKWFGVNVSEKYFRMVEIAQEYFGEIKDTVALKSYRPMFRNKNHQYKYENIYMFVNNK